MRAIRMLFAIVSVFCACASSALSAVKPEDVVDQWYGLVLELVRHTPTYSPPVASRSFAYLGVVAFEAKASGSDELRSLAGQLNGLSEVPKRISGEDYDEATVMQAAMAEAAQQLFGNTGPTGQRALAKLEEKLDARVGQDLLPDVAVRSMAYGVAIAEHVIAWSEDDGGSVVENMGFPLSYELRKGPSHWSPTNLIAQQQKPLLPRWGENRSFAMPDQASCELPPPPAYSEDASSEFYRQALEVVDVKENLTAEQRAIARFWSDDPMLTPTPPGHWISIAMQIFKRDNVAVEKRVDTLARIGIAEADAFIGCWRTKYKYNLLRPVTFIRRTMDPKWESLLNTPPFPEYPSGHSTQSGAAAMVLTEMFGENFSFEDKTHMKDGLPARSFTSFWDAAEEAGISRLYGGIHFRAAIEQGLAQGRCVGAFVNALKTKR